MSSITIDIGAYKVLKGAGFLESISLGSCVGVALFDPATRIGGLAHIMLPNSLVSARRENDTLPTKYADIAIRRMIDEMLALGAFRGRIVAKIAGGACMFESVMMDATMNIGGRNAEAVKILLDEEKIVIKAEDLGSNYGRTMQFDVATGKVTIKSAKMGIKEL